MQVGENIHMKINMHTYAVYLFAHLGHGVQYMVFAFPLPAHETHIMQCVTRDLRVPPFYQHVQIPHGTKRFVVIDQVAKRPAF